MTLSSIVRRSVAIGSAVLLASTVLAACGGSSSESDSGSSKLDTITVGLPAIPPVFSSLEFFAAKETGIYKKYGLDVTLRPFQTGTDAIKAMQTGEIDVAFGPAPFFFALASKNVPVVAMQGLDVLDWLVASTDPSITSCENLKGQAVGIDAVGGSRYIVLQKILQSCGLSIDDVDTLAFPGAQSIQAMVAGQLKTSVLHIDELASINKQGGNAQTLVNYRDLFPDDLYMTVSTRKDELEKNRDVYERFVAANMEAAKMLYDPANHDKLAKIATFSGQDQKTASESLAQFLKIKFWPTDAGLAEEKVKTTIQGQVKAGNIEQAQAPAYDDVVDLSVWEAAVKLTPKS